MNNFLIHKRIDNIAICIKFLSFSDAVSKQNPFKALIKHVGSMAGPELSMFPIDVDGQSN